MIAMMIIMLMMIAIIMMIMMMMMIIMMMIMLMILIIMSRFSLRESVSPRSPTLAASAPRTGKCPGTPT